MLDWRKPLSQGQRICIEKRIKTLALPYLNLATLRQAGTKIRPPHLEIGSCAFS